MARDEGQVDSQSFAIRREMRDILSSLIDRGWWRPNQYEQALARLGERRLLALRQVLRIFDEGRVTDEVAALEILGRLTRPEDGALLASVANDRNASEGARVASALVLLGLDRAELLTATDISGLILRWQARYVAEEPGMRETLSRLYLRAPREERVRWIALQDEVLEEPEGRAAVYEMLLELEDDAELRWLLIQGLARHQSACARAALARTEPHGDEERELLILARARLAREARPEAVPEGWSAQIGFCDGSGTFPLRLDFSRSAVRPRSIIVLLDLHGSIREVLALVGSEITRYDRAGGGDGCSEGLRPIGVREALWLLRDALGRAEKRDLALPGDWTAAERLLDPLADLDPLKARMEVAPAAVLRDGETQDLLDHTGYSGWFYDASDHLFDDLRLEVLRTCDPGPASAPSEDLLERAALRLRESGETERVALRLEHNALVHELGGESRQAAIARAAAEGCLGPRFGSLGIVRRMMRESLHPGHYFFAPVPDRTERRDLALLLLSGDKPTRGRVLAIDLAWILTRAADVWLSRVHTAERPHSDAIASLVLELASVGARWITNWMETFGDAPEQDRIATRITFGPWRASLSQRYRDTLQEAGLPAPRWDPQLDRLTDLLTWASETLVFRVCLGSCKGRCPKEADRSGLSLLEKRRFPAGEDAEARIRTWPGLYFNQPTARQRGALEALLEVSRSGRQAETFRCGLCEERRPTTARSRSLLLPLGGGEPEEVCRRCQGRYRRDPAFQAEVIRNRGRLMSDR